MAEGDKRPFRYPARDPYSGGRSEEGDAAVITAALGDIARAKEMTLVARKAGLGRESLYKALSPNGNPEFTTVLRVVEALGLKLRAVPAK